MRRNSSKKHHYLPRHYLKGFTNSDNTFFVYDKLKERIFLSNPDDSFFENNLNTVTFPSGESSDFLEDMYTEDENQSWGPFDKIRESTSKTTIELLDKMHLFLFLLILYWRLPSNIEFVEKLSEKAFLSNNEIDFFRLIEKSGENAPAEIAETIKGSSAFKKTFRQIVPFIPFYKDKDWAAKLENWRFLYTGDDKSWYIVGDNPIIIKGDSDHDFVNCLREFIFPVSGKILLININKPLNKGLPPEFGIQYNTAIIERSQRFVACQNKDFLGKLVKYYKIYVQFAKTNTIITEMFNMLEQ